MTNPIPDPDQFPKTLAELQYRREQILALRRVAIEFENDSDEKMYDLQLEEINLKIEQLAEEQGWRIKG